MLPVEVVVLGSYNQDHVWSTAQFPAPGETRIGRFATGPGGKGFNQAVACHRQGARTLFLGARGDDALGETAVRTAQAFALPADWEVRDDAATGSASIVVDARAQNLIVVAPGANEKLSRQFVHRHERTLAAAKVVVCQLESRIEASLEAFAIARRHGALTMLNPAAINEALSPELLAAAEIVTPNESEFAWLIERRGASREAIAAARDAANLPPPTLHALCRTLEIPTVVVTLGARGAFVSHADTTRCKDLDSHYLVPGETCVPVDTTGAGDAFNGGLAAGLIHYHAHPFRRAIEHANRVAALSTEAAGAANAMPTRAAVDKRFERRE